MDDLALSPPRTCARCGNEPAALSPELAGGRPSGIYCRDCLIYTHTLGTNALIAVFGAPPGLPIKDILLDSELMWIEAATQAPHTTDLAVIRERWRELAKRRYTVSAEDMQVDLDLLSRWPAG